MKKNSSAHRMARLQRVSGEQPLREKGGAVESVTITLLAAPSVQYRETLVLVFNQNPHTCDGGVAGEGGLAAG